MKLKNKILCTILTFLTLSFSLIFDLPQPAAATQKTASETGHSKQNLLSGARLRVVWVQDMGDGRDVDTLGGNLRLMGLDTGDGKGERAILGAVGNYAKPLITPRGDRVVYSDRIRKKVIRGELGRFGVARAVWGFWFGALAGSPGWTGVDLLWI